MMLCLAGRQAYAHGNEPHGLVHAPPKDAPKTATEQVQAQPREEVEMLEEVEISAAEPAKPTLTIEEAIGHMHASVVHFPIAWLYLLLFVELGVFFLKWPIEPRWLLVLLIAVIASFAAPVLTGYLNLWS